VGDQEMAKRLDVSDLVKISLSALERRALSRKAVQFELSRVITVEEVQLPGRSQLVIRTSKITILAGQTGEYRVGSKKVLVIGRSGSTGVKISLNNPAFDEIYIATRNPAAFIAKLGK